MERIVPANLDGDELWRRNGEYVDADSYDAAVARVAELEAALTHAVEIAENKIVGGTWDDLLPYRKLLSKK